MDVIEGELPAIRMLYVDDDEGLLALTERLLKLVDGGIEVEMTDSPWRARWLLESESFDIVVSDHQILEMPGFELLLELRNGRDSSTLFVIFTGWSREEVAIEVPNLGADNYLQKGGDPTAQYGILRQTLVRITEHRHAERQLREREAYLRVTLDSIVEGIVATDAGGTVVQLNRIAEEVTGYDAGTAIDEQLSDVLHPIDDATGERIDPVWRASDVDGAAELAMGTKLVTSDDDEHYTEDNMSPIRTDDGSVEGVIAVSRDVTEVYRERERRERQQRALIDLATDEMVIAGSFEDALPRITETMVTVLDVERASAWLFDDAETLRRVDQYDRLSGEHNVGTTLTVSNYPSYFAALETNRLFGVDDVWIDPVTAELRGGYLEQRDITSLLDATVRSGGEVVGVVRHEHVGEPWRWWSDERWSVAEVADNVVVALMQATDVDALPTSVDEDDTDGTRPGWNEGRIGRRAERSTDSAIPSLRFDDSKLPFG